MAQTKRDKLMEEIAALFKKWAFLVTNQGYFFRVEYYDNAHEAGDWISTDKTTMETFHKWAYKDATIAVNLETCEKADRLEWIVIHELCHILMGEADFDDVSMLERACSEIASAIYQTSERFK